MTTEKQKKLREIYETQFTQMYEGAYPKKAHKLLLENPGLENYFANSQMKWLINYLLKKNSSDLKEIKSDLETTLNRLDDMDKLK